MSGKAQRGRFITFEGGEGSGKSTQVARLVGALTHAGLEVFATREPGGSPAGEKIRKILVEGEPGSLTPLTEALLNYAQRAEHLERTIKPRLAQGSWVISDRFADSTMAYQGYGHGLGRKPIEALYKQVCGSFKPDLTLILDVPVKTGLERAASRAGNETRFEKMDPKFHERLRRGFLSIARQEPRRCVVIDASKPLNDVQRQILDAVATRLKIKFTQYLIGRD